MNQEKQMTEKESLELITQIIGRAKVSRHKTGVTAMMWGLVIAVCSLIRLSEVHFKYQMPFDIYLLTLLALLPHLLLTLKEKKQQPTRLYEDAYLDYIWLGFGICILLLVFIVNKMFAAWIPGVQEFREAAGRAPSFHIGEYVSSFFLLLYGLPTFISGAAGRFKPMLWGGLLCWGCCVAALFTGYKTDMLLVAVAALLAWFVPGLMMEKEYRMAKKELNINDV